MFCRSNGKLTPLLKAVIQGDDRSVELLSGDSEQRETRDPLGFTPLELARLLGRRLCEEFLDKRGPVSIKVQDDGARGPEVLSLADFEARFHITYRSFLYFQSYDVLKDVVSHCPFLLRSRILAKENYAWAENFSLPLSLGEIADVSIRWVDEEIGYGVFAEVDIREGSFIGEYTGIVRRLYRKHPDHNAYCFHYPTCLWSIKYYAVDALRDGNLLRFINHSDRPNLYPLCAVDRGLLHQIFVAKRLIRKGEQLTFDYGEDYWVRRRKLTIS